MAITSFDRDNLKQLRTDMDLAMATVAKKHGIKIEFGRMSFNANEVRCKAVATTTGATSTVLISRLVAVVILIRWLKFIISTRIALVSISLLALMIEAVSILGTLSVRMEGAFKLTDAQAKMYFGKAA